MHRLIRGRPMDVVDVFVYVVILNLAVQFFPAVISESFTMSLLTAVLLKITLELVLMAEHATLARHRASATKWGKALNVVVLVIVAAGSKAAVLALVNVVFGGAMSLGNFWSVTALVIVLLLGRAAVRTFLFWEETAQ